MMKKRIITLLLAALLTAFSLASCGQGGDSGTPTDTTDASGAVTDESTSDSFADNLPRDLDFAGQEIRFLVREEDGYYDEITVEAENGEIINDTVYARDIAIEDRLNIKITSLQPGCDMWGYNDFVRKSVLSGASEFDVCAGYQYYLPQLVPEGMFIDFNTLPYVDTNMSYWANEISERTTINGKMYLLAGDLSLSMLRATVVTYFNKQLAEDYGIGDMYQTVLDGQWTLSRLEETVRGTYNDINGDSVRNEGDIYGFVLVNGNYVNQFVRSCDIPITTANDDGSISIVLYNEKSVSFFDRLKTMLYNTDDCVGEGDQKVAGTEAGDNSKQFAANQILFYPAALSIADQLRNMESDFGILPLPKWDENQERYMTSAIDHFSLFAIPVTSAVPQASAATLEALCALSATTTLPSYYEVVLKEKYSRDDTSHQMLDLITAGITFDFGQIYSSALGNIGNVIKDYMSTDNAQDFTSYYASKENTFTAAFDELTAYFEG